MLSKLSGVKGSWLCPLESLPECIALFKYMGREPDRDLKERAKEIAKAYSGGSASDAIKISISLSVNGNNSSSSLFTNNHMALGSAALTFYYDAAVVETLKILPPPCRHYDPLTKEWTIDILAVPHALEFLRPIGYSPP